MKADEIPEITLKEEDSGANEVPPPPVVEAPTGEKEAKHKAEEEEEDEEEDEEEEAYDDIKDDDDSIYTTDMALGVKSEEEKAVIREKTDAEKVSQHLLSLLPPPSSLLPPLSLLINHLFICRRNALRGKGSVQMT